MRVVAKAMHMEQAVPAEDGTVSVEPAFYGGGKASLTLYKVTDKDGKQSDEALLQVTQKGRLVLVRKKNV